MANPIVFDLQHFAKSNTDAAARMWAANQRTDRIYRAMREGKAKISDFRQAVADMIVASGMNFGGAIPYFIQRYPVDEPLRFDVRPYMFSMSTVAYNSTITLMAGRQVGKCVTGDTSVITNRGVTDLRSLFEAASPIRPASNA